MPLIILFIFSEPINRWFQSSRHSDFSKEQAALDSLSAQWSKEEINTVPVEDEKTVTFFAFDPNQVSVEELVSMGFAKGLATRLINYRNKGGKFLVKTDLLKLYGMDSTFYLSVEPFILLPAKVDVPKRELPTKPEFTKKEVVRFDLNHADTTVLKTIYGIGSKLSLRIISFRQSLGGFISVQQLYEVYGLDSIVVDRLAKVSFIREDYLPRTLNLNTANEEELEAHPYISKRMARAIVTYRFQHGKFGSVEDLLKIQQLEENQLNKTKPYLTVE